MKSTIENQFLKIDVMHRGAELCSVLSNNKEYIWQANSEFWGKHSPVLFPIVGTLKNNQYFINGQKYQMLRHGFARDMDFELIDKISDKMTFELKSTSKTLEVYPFEFDFQISYQLIESSLIVSFLIKNNSCSTMPFSIGAHPAFALNDDFENYQLCFDKQEILKCSILENDLVSNRIYDIKLINKCLKLHYNTFKNDALIFKKLKSKLITILENKKPLLSIEFSDFKNLGIWTKNQAPFICIEPWLGYADIDNSDGDFYNKEGIEVIDKNSTFECQYSIMVL